MPRRSTKYSLTMINGDSEQLLSEIAEIYRQIFARLDPERRAADRSMSRFYPYIGINHTIRVRQGQVFVRLAEICHDMPMDAQSGPRRHSGTEIIGKNARLVERRNPMKIYPSLEMRQRADHSRRTRGRKVVTGTKGEVYDLDEIFDSLNFWYFGGRSARPTLTWSPRKSFHISGPSRLDP